MSLLYGYDNVAVSTEHSDGGTVKTFTTSVVFTKYGNRRFVKVFDTGILLMGIVTVSARRTSPVHSGMVYYSFCSPYGTTKIRKIYSYNGNYFAILNKDDDDKVLNVRNLYTVPNACSVMVELGQHSRAAKATGPPGPVKLNITLHYTEFPSVNYNSSSSTLAR